MSFNIALSGLNAALTDLSVTGNNVANASTTGFKESRTEFGDVYAVGYQAVSKNAVGGGVRVSQVAQLHSQGNIEFTSNNLDLAVSGQGFFVVSDGGEINYTRAGSFGLDRDGYVVNASGQRLQTFPYDSASSTYNTAQMQDLQLTTGLGQPAATATVDVGVNFTANPQDENGNAKIFDNDGAFDPADPTTYNHTTSVTVYDSLGVAHTQTMYYRKMDPTDAQVAAYATGGDNLWQTWMYMDGTRVAGPGANSTMAGTPAATPADVIQFNSGGDIVRINGTAVTAGASGSAQLTPYTYTPGNGANAMSITVDYKRTTQYSSDFSVNYMTQDGYTAGRLSGIDVDDTGIAFARFTNGQSEILGKVALATFQNPQGLTQVGNTNWKESYGSGAALNGEAGSGNFGLIQSGALEASNVELSAQLVQMIVAQRNFQANSQMLSTEDQVTQNIFNIR